MMSRRAVNSTSAIIGTGRAIDRITWLTTRAWVALTPRPTTMKAGIMVTRRRTQIGMRKLTKPCMIIWPAMVPTTELDVPEAISEMRKTAAAAPPSSGVSVW